jgi:hypothetical protein
MAFPQAIPEDQATARYFQTESALARILSEAPYLPRCSDNKTAARVRPRDYAIRYPYMQINRSGMVSWLIFDLDHANAWIWDHTGLPAPNLIVRNRTSGGSHLYYAIEPVCTTENARRKPIEYMMAIYTAFAIRLQADGEYHSGPVAKTPGHPWWQTTELHNAVYPLGTLADYVDLPRERPWAKHVNLDAVSHSRHCILFEELRHYAYSIVGGEREHGNFQTFTHLLEAWAHNKNNYAARGLGFTENLPLSSIRSTVKSVANWTWTRYTGSGGCHRGVMNLDKDLPLPERQRLAAARTHELRKKATESQIRGACRLLQQKGEALAQAVIARTAHVTRQTVANFKHVIEEVKTMTILSTVTPLPTSLAKTVDVKFAVHQVSGLGKTEKSNPHRPARAFAFVTPWWIHGSDHALVTALVDCPPSVPARAAGQKVRKRSEEKKKTGESDGRAEGKRKKAIPAIRCLFGLLGRLFRPPSDTPCPAFPCNLTAFLFSSMTEMTEFFRNILINHLIILISIILIVASRMIV